MGIKRSERTREIRRRRHRQKKLGKLRRQLEKAKGEERARIIAKIKKVSPQAPIDL